MTFDQATENISPDHPPGLKTRLLSLTAEQCAEIRLSYSYRLWQAWLRDMGGVNFFLGGLTFLLGIGVPGNPLLKTLQAFFGLATILVSVWSIVSPMPLVITIWTLALGIAGIWNIFIAITDQTPLLGLFGLLQLWWTYRLYRNMTIRATKPNADSLRSYDALQHAVQKLNISDDEDLDFIRLKVRRLWWQGFLLQDRMVLASRQGIAFLIVEGSKTAFTFKGDWTILGKRIAGTVGVEGGVWNKVTFPRSTVERYNRWKGLSDAETIAWLDAFDLNARKRLPIRIAVILLLAATIVFLLFWAVFAVVIVATLGQ